MKLHFRNFKIIIIFLIVINLSGYALAEEEYTDDFIINSNSWTEQSGNWKIANGIASCDGKSCLMTFDRWDGTMYISEVDLTAFSSRYSNFSSVGFYLYYKDSDNYVGFNLRDDNRNNNNTDRPNLFFGGDYPFIRTQIHIDTSTNKSIEFDPNVMHHLKVVRLNKKIYIYFDNCLTFTTEFKDENPAGKVGLYVYECIGYFDNFYLRSITTKNASDYINKFNLT